MKPRNFTFIFDPIIEKGGTVKIFNHNDKRAYKAHLSLRDSDLYSEIYNRVPSISADLLDIAVAVHTVDRNIRRIDDTSVTFDITLPVRNIEILSSQLFNEYLDDTLNWYTGDHWKFKFVYREVSGREAEIQSRLPFGEKVGSNTEIILWSGGLDSLAGLYNNLKKDLYSKFVLVGAGSSSNVRITQKEVARLVDQNFPERIQLKLVPFFITVPKMHLIKNRHQRSRGFVFLTIGAACAYSKGKGSLSIYENGIGAINLPYTACEIGLDHTRSVNPISLIKMSQLFSIAFGKPFTIQNPYMFWTKAEICRFLVEDDQRLLIESTMTCDRPRREKGIPPIHCGFCSSCLLRRQALASLGYSDPTKYYYNEMAQLMKTDYFHAMSHQVDVLKILLNQDNTWNAFTKEYVGLSDIKDSLDGKSYRHSSNDSLSIEHSITNLYQRYVNEWDIFMSQGLPASQEYVMRDIRLP